MSKTQSTASTAKPKTTKATASQKATEGKAQAEEKAQVVRGFQLTDAQIKRCAKAQANGEKVADVKREIAAALVKAGSLTPEQTENGHEVNEALYRAVRAAMRASVEEVAA